nr:helix-turn-helix transcriptional regulator [Metabacillus litoralis]
MWVDDPVELIPQIGEIRKNKGLLQKFVADKCNISQQMLSEYEKGKTYPKAPILFRISDVLEVKVDDLYKRLEEK